MTHTGSKMIYIKSLNHMYDSYDLILINQIDDSIPSDSGLEITLITVTVDGSDSERVTYWSTFAIHHFFNNLTLII